MALRRFRPVWLATAALLLAPTAASAAWTELPTPNVPEANSGLHAVDCSSANSCIAVGGWHSGPPIGGDGGTLAERWDGTSWQVMPTPELPGYLSGVSCPWPTFCFAVDSTSTGVLVEVWNGTRWSVQSTPDVPGGVLNAVSCSGILACTAVGERLGGGGSLAMRWEGSGWHVQPTPNPAGPRSLNNVSCPLKRTCTAVGYSLSDGSPFVTRWYGLVNAWGLQSAPKPAGAESASLTGVSCPVVQVCVAVGSSTVHLGPTTGMAERRIGPTWSLLPTPPGPPQNPGAGVYSLAAISCPTLALCRAVGRAPDGLNQIAERFDGTNWQFEPIPLMASGTRIPSLTGVSCPSRSFCVAVGNVGFRFSGGPLSAKWTP
jgi:hypothetical protein